MRFILVLTLSCLILCARAQKVYDRFETEVDTTTWEYKPFVVGRYYFPFYQQVSIYAQPDARSKVYHKTTSFADTLRIVEVTDKPSKFKGVMDVWYRVSFPYRGKRVLGYVPGQFLARMHVRDEQVIYLVSPLSYEKEELSFAIKMLNHEFKQFKEQKIVPYVAYYYNDTTSAGLEGGIGLSLGTGQGLSGVYRTLRFESESSACSYHRSHEYFFLDHTYSLIASFETQSTWGAYGNWEETLVFPDDSAGVKNTILKNRIEEDGTADLEESQLRYKSDIRLTYLWNGKTFTVTDSTCQRTMVPAENK